MEYPTEQEYAEAFGVEVEESENGPEGAQGTSEGPEGQGDGQSPENSSEGNGEAGTGQNQSSSGTETGTGNGDGQQDDPAQPPVMSPEERHRQAAARRTREEQARAAAEQQRVDKVYADMFAGQTNPFTGRPITTEAEYREYQAERSRRQQTAQLQKAGIDPQTIRGIVDQQLAPMQQRLQAAELAAIQERARTANARAQEAVNAALKNISAMDPSIKSVEDIAQMPTARRFNDLVQKGIGLEDAFYLANRKAIEDRKAAAARTATLNGMANRQHLNPVGASSAKQPVEVPPKMAEIYREFNPGATDEEIRKAYEAELKH